METTLAILMALGIYVGIPVVVGMAVATIFVVKDRKLQKAAQTAKTATKAHTKAA
jgi:type III secretory pathway component EscV